MVKTIGEAYEEAKELEKKGLLRGHLEKLVRSQEEILGMKHFGIPELVVTMDIHGKPCYKNGGILLQYWDKEYLYHELGHFYLDRLRIRLSLASLREDRIITEWWEARNKLISEGIAVYFGREMKGGKDDFNDSEYPKKIKDFLTSDFNFLLRLYYSGGYHLAKPILDGFGVEEGCKHLLLDPPKKRELTRLPEYRKRILRRVLKSEVKKIYKDKIYHY